MITIFIHGTLPPKAVCKLPILDKFFFCPLGLTLAKNLDLCAEEVYHLAQVPFTLEKADPEEFNSDKFYLFGWSGKLSHRERVKAAHELYDHIKNLKLEKIRIISHSHGGNVALNLKTVSDLNGDNLFSVEELILLACPVQKHTSELIKSSIFKKKYVFHSHADILQILDPQGLHNLFDNLKEYKIEIRPLFSERHFEKHTSIIHINMFKSNRPLMHIEFLLEKFLNFLPKALKIANSREHFQQEISIDLDHDAC